MKEIFFGIYALKRYKTEIRGNVEVNYCQLQDHIHGFNSIMTHCIKPDVNKFHFLQWYRLWIQPEIVFNHGGITSNHFKADHNNQIQENFCVISYLFIIRKRLPPMFKINRFVRIVVQRFWCSNYWMFELKCVRIKESPL